MGTATTHRLIGTGGEELRRGTQAGMKHEAWYEARKAIARGETTGTILVLGIHTGTEYHREDIAKHAAQGKRKATAAEKRLAARMFGGRI
jgi:hypothetical protein